MRIDQKLVIIQKFKKKYQEGERTVIYKDISISNQTSDMFDWNFFN